MMTHRERMLAVLQHRPPDQIPWAPRMEMWYRANQRQGTLPAKYRGWDLRSIYHDQNLTYPGKAGPRAFHMAVEGIETITRKKGEETRVETITPVGTLSTVSRSSPELRAQGVGALEVEHWIKDPDDYAVVEWIYEHTKVTPNYEEYRAYDMECGDEGVPQTNTPWSPPEYIFSQLIGWNDCYYHVHDYPQKIEHLLEVMSGVYWEIHRICAESPALIVSHGAHFHSQMTPPPIFRQYFLPYFKQVSAFYHQHGKLLQFHGDADITGLEHLILEAGYDIAECLVTDPMVPITLRHLREVWGNQIIIWGGVPSILLCDPFTEEDLVTYMHDLLKVIAPGDAFILGVADMAVPATIWERFELVGQMVKDYGRYPIDPSRVP